jgi:tryptophan-rich sensory protein
MTDGYAILSSLGACLIAAAIEGVCAGGNVKSFFSQLRFPPYSAPLWVWSIIGVLYYAVFGFVIYRLLRLDEGARRKLAALAFILLMMIINALTNYVIFRIKNLRLSFIIGALFPVIDIVLLLFLINLDQLAAWALVPYLLYRIYAVWWGYELWKLNGDRV